MATLKDLTVLGSSRFVSDTYANNIYANKFVVFDGTAAGFLKANGTIDTKAYITSSAIPTAIGAQIVYDSTNKLISLKTIDGSVLGTPVDATDFIKDGMVSDVSVYGGNLVITFNTDSGEDPISIPLTSFFDPDLYYTKTQVDASFAKDASLLWAKGNGSNSIRTIANNTDASITGSHAVALGRNATIQGNYGCVAEGSNCVIRANSDTAHAEGYGCTINGGASYSHAEGYHTTINYGAVSSHVEGHYTIVHNHSEHASGHYNNSHYTSRGVNVNNDVDGSLNTTFSIGIGTDNNDRRNALEIMQNADTYIVGIGAYDGSNYQNASTLQEVIMNLENAGSTANLMTNVMYSELKALRDSSGLTPGMQYRITDYECTTTQIDTSVAGHVFDIIVIADSSTVLNENARATWHDGDTYFQNCKLDKWQIMYTIDNDDSLYSWADTNAGKGVIYYMKDEYCNECQYDFKNILFKRWEVTDASLTSFIVGHEDNPDSLYYGLKDEYEDGEYYEQSPHNAVFSSNIGYFYTFDLKDVSSGISYDMTVKSGDGLYEACLSNSITSAAFGMNGLGYTLPNVIFLNSYPDIASQDMPDETPVCACNHIENSTSATFGNSCSNNIIKDFAFCNTLGSYCSSNIITANSANIYGNYCCENISDGNHIMLEKLAVGNKIGRSCHNIEIGENSQSNLMYANSYSISIGANSNGNIFYGYNYAIKIGNYSGGNLFHSAVSEIIFGTPGTVKDHYSYITIEQGNMGINLNCTATLDVNDYYRNIKILQGTHMTTNQLKTINDSNKNQTYQTVYQPANSLVISV